MAIVKMKKLSLVGLEKERHYVIDAFSALNCVELADIADIELTKRIVDDGYRNELAVKMGALNDCLDSLRYFQTERADMLKELKKSQELPQEDFKAKDPLKGKKIEIALNEFLSAHKREYHLLSKVVDKCRENKIKVNEIDSEISKMDRAVKDLAPYTIIDMPFSEIKDSKHTTMLFGVLKNFDEKSVNKITAAVPEAAISFSKFEKTEFVVLAVCLNKDKDAVAAKLAELNYNKCQFDFNVTAKQKIRQLYAEREKLVSAKFDLINESAGLIEFADEIKLLYDYYNIEYQKESGNENICKTSKTFILEAWLPADKEETVKNKVLSVTSASIINFSDPRNDELPPTITKNNKFVEPFTTITNMYDVPNYHEKDPNAILSIFYFIFFGIMLGDVGYGFIIMLGSFLLLRLLKPEGEMARLLKVFFIGGISSVIWGFLFGSWFAIQSDLQILQPLLFDPIKNSMQMMIMSIAFGIVHIIAGFAMRAYNKLSKGRILDAVLDDFTWIGTLAGIAMLAAGMLLEIDLLTTIGTFTAIGCLAILVFTGGRKNKNVFGKAFGGLGNLYSVITVFSDVLSYIRLFGLGLASGVISQVFNTLGMSMMAGFMIPFGVIVLIIGHVLNIAIGLLGIYVHDSRLQFIEFFSKFYEGQGKPFRPLANKTEYIKILNVSEEKNV